MRTLKPSWTACAVLRLLLTEPKSGSRIFFLCVAALSLGLTACKEDTASQAIETDANGYLCLKCGAKLYTDRSVFIGPKCPQCKEDKLMQAVGYYCEKDQHLTIRASQGDRQGAVCERCQTPLVNAMRSPREKELKAWGATKVPT
jgi:transcription initiation factor IIE alpha subunit